MDAEPRRWLREAIAATLADHPSAIDTSVLLADHLRRICTRGEGEADYAGQWALIKRRLTKHAEALLQRDDWMTESKHASGRHGMATPVFGAEHPR